jgi:hypothetical protein
LDGKQWTLNGTSQWLLGNMLMFYQDGMDENAGHTLNITNLSGGEALSLNSIIVKQFDTASPGNNPSNG